MWVTGTERQRRAWFTRFICLTVSRVLPPSPFLSPSRHTPLRSVRAERGTSEVREVRSGHETVKKRRKEKCDKRINEVKWQEIYDVVPFVLYGLSLHITRRRREPEGRYTRRKRNRMRRVAPEGATRRSGGTRPKGRRSEGCGHERAA